MSDSEKAKSSLNLLCGVPVYCHTNKAGGAELQDPVLPAAALLVGGLFPLPTFLGIL